VCIQPRKLNKCPSSAWNSLSISSLVARVVPELKLCARVQLELELRVYRCVIARTALLHRLVHPGFFEIALECPRDKDHVDAVTTGSERLGAWVVGISSLGGVEVAEGVYHAYTAKVRGGGYRGRVGDIGSASLFRRCHDRRGGIGRVRQKSRLEVCAVKTMLVRKRT